MLDKIPVIDIAATGQAIKRHMIAAGVTVRVLTEILNFYNNTPIYRWLNGGGLPSTENLVILCRVLGVKAEDIIITKDIDIARADE